VSIARLWIVTALGLGALAGMLAPLSTVDLAYAIRLGREIMQTAAIPAVDTYTFTAAGRPWVDQQWLAQVVFAIVHGWGGWEGLVILRAVLIAGIVGLIAMAARARGRSARTSALVAIGSLLLASPALALRAQLLGALLLALALFVVSSGSRRALWLLPPIAAVWANVHGSFILAPVVAAWALGEAVQARRPLGVPAVALGLTVLVTTLTPFGPGVWAYALSLLTNSTVRELITEWQPASVLTPLGAAFYLTVAVVALVIALGARRGRTLPATWAWLATLAVLAIGAERNVLWWALGAAVGTVSLLPPGVQRDAPGIPRLNGAVAAVLAAAILVALPWWRSATGGAERSLLADAPTGAVEAVSSLMPAGSRVLVPQRWGSWFEFAAPQILVAVDSRIELFPAEVWQEYLLVQAAGPGWEEVLERWRVDAIVTEPQESLSQVIESARGWVVRHRDESGLLFVRVEAG